MHVPERMHERAKRTALTRVATRVAELNVEREDDFQDTAMGEVLLAEDAFRADGSSELPPPGSDPLLDALMDLARDLDASPEAVAAACDRALEMAGATPAEERPLSTAC